MAPSHVLPTAVTAATALALAPSLACPVLASRAALARATLATLAPGSAAYRAAYAGALALALADVAHRMAAGAGPAYVAAYVRQAGPVGAGLALRIEDAAHPGTFAEAVFAILAD